MSSPAPASDPDARFMRLALAEAAQGLGQTSPNPAVGAVVVRDGKILGRGFHRAAGRPHAEIEALRSLPPEVSARGATLYVTLEPCSTHGRTPPCTEAILAAGLARVVIGATDPNPRHAGRAVRLLAAGGVAVAAGVLGRECAALNRAFNRWIVSGEPWVIAKAALTRDGSLTRPPGESRWLSGELARAHAHRQRALVDAILIGAGTLRKDNPRLTVRAADGTPAARQPWRVVLTRHEALLPTEAHLFTDAWRGRTLVFEGQDLATVWRELGRRDITSVLVEGGAQTLNAAFRADRVDEVQLYVTPWQSGNGQDGLEMNNAAGQPVTLIPATIQVERLGPDVFVRGEVQPGPELSPE